MLRSWAWRVGVAVFLVAAGCPARGQLIQGRDFHVTKPAPTWAGERWPVVVAVAGPNDDLAAVSDDLSPLTAERGALLVTLVGGDMGRMQLIVNQIFEEQPVLPGATVLLGQGDMALWCRDETLRLGRDVAGLIAVNPTVGLPTRVARPGPPQKAVILYTDDGFANPSISMSDELRRMGLLTGVRKVAQDELRWYLGLALSELLPPPAPRSELHDPRINAFFQALPGWVFTRRDGLFAVAQPAAGGQGPPIQISTGRLGERTYDEYVKSTTAALAIDGIEVVSQETLAALGTPVRAHAFHFIDRRRNMENAVYWIQLGHDGDIISLRSVAPIGQLEPFLPIVRSLAFAISFGAPGPDGERVVPVEPEEPAEESAPAEPLPVQAPEAPPGE